MTGIETFPAEFARRVERVRNDIDACALRCNRAPSDITLVAVSKTHAPDAIREGLSLGLTDFGENRVQEAESKIPIVGRDAACWHLIGHLQSNKARKAVDLFDVIHSLDSIVLAQRLDRICVESDREQLPVLIQVDLGHEEMKTGVEEKNLSELVSTVAESERLQLRGLMTLPPFFDEAEKARPFFRRLRELRDELQAKGAFGNRRGDLSMGMTHDYQIAIEEGASIVRIGTAIFGERNQLKTAN